MGRAAWLGREEGGCELHGGLEVVVIAPRFRDAWGGLSVRGNRIESDVALHESWGSGLSSRLISLAMWGQDTDAATWEWCEQRNMRLDGQ